MTGFLISQTPPKLVQIGSMTTTSSENTELPAVLEDMLDRPWTVYQHDRAVFDAIAPEVQDRFRLKAARRYLTRKAGEIPVVGELLGSNDPESIATLNDLVPFLLDEDAYKSYDPAWLDHGDYTALTKWMGHFTRRDYSSVDMAGCGSISEWCERLLDQTGDRICHSSGTSGTLSFVPRSVRDSTLFADALMWNFQSPAYGAARAFFPDEVNDITLFVPVPRQMFRITTSHFNMLEQRYHTPPVQAFDMTSPPEFAIAQGKMRKAARQGDPDAALKDPIVAAWRERVLQTEAEMPTRMADWLNNLIANFQGHRIIFQGSFDMAWAVAQEMKKRGVTAAFDHRSIFAVIGGVKDGSSIPEDWQEQFQEIMGVSPNSFNAGWGMSEVNGGLRQCPSGQLHFPPHIIGFLLEPGTRNPLPRQGTQTGQLAILEVVSEDCWGGMVSGDGVTIDWDSQCACGRPGPLLEPSSIHRV
jgi:hypothetical protein